MNHPISHLTDEGAQRLLDGLLTGSELEAATAHVGSCPECASLVDAYRELCLSLSAMPGPELPADFTAGVLERVERAERSATRERRAAFLVAASVLLGFAAVIWAGGLRGWIPATASLADDLGLWAQAIRIGAHVVPVLLGALRLPVALLAAVLALPFLFALSRTIPSPRTEAT